MADSLREKIVHNLKESLEVIRISNGYEVDLESVQRWEQDGNDLRETPCVILYPDEESKDDENTWPETRCTLTALLMFWFRHDHNVYECSTDEALNRFLAAIEKAVMQDATRGGNAVTTRNLGNTPFEAEEGQPYAGLIIRIEVLYKTKFDDPYT